MAQNLYDQFDQAASPSNLYDAFDAPAAPKISPINLLGGTPRLIHGADRSTTAGEPPQAGGNWEAVSEELGESPLGIKPEMVPDGSGPVSDTASSFGKAGAGFGQFLTSPKGMAETGAAMLPGVGLVQRAKFLYDIGASAFDAGKTLYLTVRKIADDPAHATPQDVQAVSDNILGVAASMFMAGKLGEHEFTALTGKPIPTTAKPPVPPAQDPLATKPTPTTPQGEKPPVIPASGAGKDVDAVPPPKEQATLAKAPISDQPLEDWQKPAHEAMVAYGIHPVDAQDFLQLQKTASEIGLDGETGVKFLNKSSADYDAMEAKQRAEQAPPTISSPQGFMADWSKPSEKEPDFVEPGSATDPNMRPKDLESLHQEGEAVVGTGHLVGTSILVPQRGGSYFDPAHKSPAGIPIPSRMAKPTWIQAKITGITWEKPSEKTGKPRIKVSFSDGFNVFTTGGKMPDGSYLDPLTTVGDVIRQRGLHDSGEEAPKTPEALLRSVPPEPPAKLPSSPTPPSKAPDGGEEPDLVAARSILDQYGTIGLSQLQRKAKLPYARAQAAIDTLQKTGEIERVGPNSPWTKVKPPESVKPPQPAIEKATPSLESPVGAKLPDIAVEKQPGQPKATGEPSKNQGKAPRTKSTTRQPPTKPTESPSKPSVVPKLAPGVKQGDLLASTQKEDLSLAGEKGTDTERLAEAKRQQEATAKAAQEFEAKNQQALPGTEKELEQIQEKKKPSKSATIAAMTDSERSRYQKLRSDYTQNEFRKAVRKRLAGYPEQALREMEFAEALEIEHRKQTLPGGVGGSDDEGETGPGMVDLGASTPGHQAPISTGPTAMKYRTIDAERQQRGLPPLTKPEGTTDQATMDKAMAAIDRNPQLPYQLVKELNAHPRTIEDWENHVLLLHKIDLRDSYAKSARDAAQAYDDSKQFPDRLADMQRANIETARLSDELEELERASRVSGSARGRALRSLQVMANEDYSLAGLEQQARAAKGGEPITNEERAELQKVAADYKAKADALQKHVDEKDARISQMEAAKKLDDIQRSTKPTYPEIIIKTAESFVAKLDTAADAARKRSLERWKRTSAGIDPTMLTDAAIIGASHIAHIGLDFAKWSARMVEDLGDAVKPHLQTIYEASQKQVDALADTAPKPIAEKVKRVVKKMDAPTKQATIKGKIEAKFKAGKKSDTSNDVQQLARSFVEQGVRGRDALIDAVHGVLSDIDPEITRRDTMDAISGYGDFKQLSKDEISVALRDLKGQMQQVGKLEDMVAGKAPVKTGVERRTPSDEERRLQKQVAEKKKEGGFISRDPEGELRTALQTAKTVVENQIKDLTREIETREKIVKERRPLIPDQALIDLKARRDELKKQHDEVFANAEDTHAEKVRRATALLDSQIKKTEEQLKTGEIFPAGKSKGPMGPLDPQIEIRRQRLQELKDRRDALRESSQPSVVPEVRDANRLAAGLKAEEKALKKRIDDLERQISSKTKDVKTPSVRPTNPAIDALKVKRDALKAQYDDIFGRAGLSDAERLAAWKKRAQESIAEYQRRLDEKDFATQPKRVIPMDAEAQKLLAEKEAVAKKFKEKLRDWKRANLPKTERAFDFVSNVRRFSVLSGVNVLGKLAAYSATKVPTMALGELAGNINRLPGLRNVAEKAPSEGENSLPILARAVAKGFTKGIMDSWSVLRTGKSDLKSAYSNRLEEGWQWYNIPQQIHEVIKSPLRRIAFETSLAKRMNFAAKNGADITDPLTQLALAKDAYMDSDRALLLEQNKYANSIKRTFKDWEKATKETGHPSLGGKLSATVGRIELPILTVPFNYMKQTLENAFGLITGTVKYRAAVKRGLDNLKPEEADAIARHFKYGSIGAGMLLWGFFDGYNNGANGTFGGFWEPNEKRKPNQAGVVGMRVGGHNISGLFLHNPMISVAQFGHTIGAIMSSKFKKTGEERGLPDGVAAGAFGLLNQSPVGGAVELVSTLSDPRSFPYAFGEHVKGILIPQLMNEAAQYQDKDANGNPVKRSPNDQSAWYKSLAQHVETGVPYLRENVPVKVQRGSASSGLSAIYGVDKTKNPAKP